MERAASSIIPPAVTHLGSPTETSCGSSAGLPRLSKMLGSAPPSRSVEHPTRGRDRRRALGRSGLVLRVHIGFVFVFKHRRYYAATRQVPANFQNDTSRNLEFGDRRESTRSHYREDRDRACGEQSKRTSSNSSNLAHTLFRLSSGVSADESIRTSGFRGGS